MIGICEVSMSEDKGEKTTWCFIDHHHQHNHHYQCVEIICCHSIEQNVLYVRRLILLFDRNKWDHFNFLFIDKHPTEKETKQQLSTNNEIIELLCKSHWKMNQWFHLYFSNWCISLLKNTAELISLIKHFITKFILRDTKTWHEDMMIIKTRVNIGTCSKSK